MDKQPGILGPLRAKAGSYVVNQLGFAQAVDGF
ncbi:hypothetical protein J2W86_000605 [Delftia lacustris]|nr:hypothetical protein [Delftia lacustris]